MGNISFVIGSGFSYPRKIPGVEELSKLLIETKSDNLNYHSYGFVSIVPSGGLESSTKSNAYTKFYEEFLAFYLSMNKDFNYEVFFDYYYSLFKSCSYDDPFKLFVEKFKNIPSRKSLSENDLLQHFHDIFSQLVAKFLKVEEYYHETEPQKNAILYCKFLSLINPICLDKVVNIHTTNHDLLIEDILNKSSYLQGNFSDGYTSLGSKYFGEVVFENPNVCITHKVWLRFFSDDYKKPLRLFKLHGSVDTYIFQDKDEDRIRKVPGIMWFFKEEINDNGDIVYSKVYEHENFPDFLTGKLSKGSYFYDQKFYKNLFKHFNNNISECDALVIIGYGFGDEGINKCIVDGVDSTNKVFIVIDIAEKESLMNKLSANIPNLHYFKKSIDDLNDEDVEAIMNLINKIS